MKFIVLQAGAVTGGKLIDLHWELLPQCNLKDSWVHIHPNAIETYEVLDGEMEFFVKNKWLLAKKATSLPFLRNSTYFPKSNREFSNRLQHPTTGS